MRQALCSLAVSAFLAYSIISCAGSRSALSLDASAIPAAKLIERIHARASALQSLTGKGSLWFEGPKGAGSAFFTMALRKPDSLLVRLKGPFGIEVGFMFMSRERFVVYNGMDNRAIAGVPTDASLREIIPLDLTYDQILSAFAGSFTPEQVNGRLLRYAADGDSFLLAYSCGVDTCLYWIDPETDTVVKYLVKNAEGKTILEAEAGNFLERDGVSAPRTIQLRFEDQQLSISYSSLELNAPEPSFSFSIPSTAHMTKK